MKLAGVQRDVISYTAAITACGESACVIGEQHELATTLLKEASAAGHKLAMPHKRAPLQCEQVAA
eukprot:5093-Heterococcus_DN1.PRE.2